MKTTKLFLPVIMAFMLFFSTSCFLDLNAISGSGSIVTENRTATDFTSIELQTAADVEIVKGNTYKVSVSDYENIIQYLNVEVVNNRLIIKKNPLTVNLWNSKAKVVVTMPDPLYSLKLAGSGTLKVNSAFNDLEFLLLTGSGNVDLKCNCQLDKLEATISGSGNMNATGTVQDLYTKISGSGNIRFSNMKATNATCTLSGSGNMYVYIEDKLEAFLSGSGDIVYSGSPSVNSNLSGSGHIYKN
ncbi:MAG: DUF2807 domain-containing protein [Paludibacter sp.]|nr:DUF2807 domain-containing protein [Paludibacter sp.]